MKQYCKECQELKDLSEYYSHPQGKNGVLSRCRECIKRGRKSEVEREMARERDKRYYEDPRVKERYNRLGKKWRSNNIEKRHAHIVVSNYFEKKGIMKPDTCSNCGSKEGIEMHHEDYSKPKELIILCRKCHRGYHSGKIDIKKDFIFLIP